MKKNMGTGDRVLRIGVALVVGVLLLTDVVTGWLAVVLGVVAVAFLVTGFVGFCPGYVPFGVKTTGSSSTPQQ